MMVGLDGTVDVVFDVVLGSLVDVLMLRCVRV